MNSNAEVTFVLLGWIAIAVFIVARNYFRKKQKKENLDKYAKSVEILRKLIASKNDSEFVNNSLNLNKEINKNNNLYFKSVDAAFQYMEKFFSNYPLEIKHLYHGKIINLDKKGTLALVKVMCLINNKTDYAVVTAVKSNDLKINIKKGDFVYVGIEEVRNIMPYKKLISSYGLQNISNVKNSKGVIVKKLSLGLNIKTNQFEFDE